MKRESGVEFTVNCGSEVPQDDERKDGSSFGISEADQLSECDDDSSDDNNSVLEEDGTEPQLLNKELGFLCTAPRTRSGRMVRTSNKAVLWLWFLTKVRKTDRIKTFIFLVKREMSNFLSVKCETAILFSEKRDQYPPLPPSTF